MFNPVPFFTMTKSKTTKSRSCPNGGGKGGGGGAGGRAATNQSLIQGGSSLRSNPLTVILLPLRPASLTQKNPPRRKMIHGMRPIGCKEQSIRRLEDFLIEYPVCVISVVVF